ncbi:MAG: YebC/PmpR family DNA-binding transcriptional regulator [Candidatus Levybacteria bacterium]|nr:YebC/PmpR family DNA-binding transcriptional regulator [Candidatus Levybacteria bacterium]
MSGHSKWSTIKRQKGAADIKRGQMFTKIANSITIAVKQGGAVTDPESNSRLRLAIDVARSQNMPKENIQRAIDRGAGKGGAGDLQEIIYEGFTLGGVSVVIEAATDNPTRTTAEIKNLFSKSGASFGQPGSSSYQFQRVGLITVSKTKSFDDIFAAAAESGAEDVEEVGEDIFIYTEPTQLGKVKDELSSRGFTTVDASYYLKPMSKVKVENKETYERVLNFLSSLEGLDDVQKVYSNLSYET